MGEKTFKNSESYWAKMKSGVFLSLIRFTERNAAEKIMCYLKKYQKQCTIAGINKNYRKTANLIFYVWNHCIKYFHLIRKMTNVDPLNRKKHSLCFWSVRYTVFDSISEKNYSFLLELNPFYKSSIDHIWEWNLLGNETM